MYRRLRRGEGIPLGQKAGLQRRKFQFIKEGIQRRFVGNGILVRNGNGRRTADGGQILGKEGAVPPGRQLGKDGFGQPQRIKILVYRLQRARLGNQLQCRFFADTGHTGDVVGGVAHQGLYVDQPNGIDAVLFPEYLGRVENILFRLDQDHRGAGGHQLQGIPISRQNVRVVFAANLRLGGYGAQHVVCLIAFHGDHLTAQSFCGPHSIGKLHGQLLGHTLTGSLVLIVHFVAECRSLPIKSAYHFGGGQCVHVLFQNIQKTVYGVRGQTALGGEGTDSVKRPVQNTVSVDDKQIFHSDKASFPFFSA